METPFSSKNIFFTPAFPPLSLRLQPARSLLPALPLEYHPMTMEEDFYTRYLRVGSTTQLNIIEMDWNGTSYPQVWCENFHPCFETKDLGVLQLMWDVYQKKCQRSADFGWFECFLMFDKGGTWHNTTFFNLLFTLHFPSCPLSKLFAIRRLPPSMWKVLGKASSNISCIKRPNLEPTSSQIRIGDAEFPVDGDRSESYFHHFEKQKHPVTPEVFHLPSWGSGNQPINPCPMSCCQRIRPARHYLSNALGGQRVMRLPHLRSFPGPFTERGSEWTKFVASTWRRSLPKFVLEPFFLYLKHLNFSSSEINWN